MHTHIRTQDSTWRTGRGSSRHAARPLDEDDDDEYEGEREAGAGAANDDADEDEEGEGRGSSSWERFRRRSRGGTVDDEEEGGEDEEGVPEGGADAERDAFLRNLSRYMGREMGSMKQWQSGRLDPWGTSTSDTWFRQVGAGRGSGTGGWVVGWEGGWEGAGGARAADGAGTSVW